MKKPFFSIVIPTFNRSEELRKALISILRQDFDDYEIIITDNSSNNESEKMIRSLNDKRIHHFKNTTNIGFNRNLYKGIKLSQGKYIFLLGDDDIILRKDTFRDIFIEILKNKYGFVRLKFIYQKNTDTLFTPYFEDKKSLFLEKNQSNIKILEFLYNKAIFSHIAGLIFKNIKNIKIEKIELAKGSEDVEISNFWIAFLLSAAKSNGAYIDINHPMIVKWAVYKELGAYLVKKGRITEEQIFELLSKYLNKNDMKAWKNKVVYGTVSLLPSIRYYSSKKNLLLYAKRLSELNKEILKNKSFYFFLIVGFFMPKLVWDFLRRIYHSKKIVKDEDVLKEFELLKSSLS